MYLPSSAVNCIVPKGNAAPRLYDLYSLFESSRCYLRASTLRIFLCKMNRKKEKKGISGVYFRTQIRLFDSPFRSPYRATSRRDAAKSRQNLHPLPADSLVRRSLAGAYSPLPGWKRWRSLCSICRVRPLQASRGGLRLICSRR